MDDAVLHPVCNEQKVIADELERIRVRRNIKQSESIKDLTGLALSGGGVRSATFNLGLLQALHRHKVLQDVDYLSTVSGGGYIGSAFTWFNAKLKNTFPFGSGRSDDNKSGGKIIGWIRQHGCYLAPGNGLDGYALMAAIFRGIFVNILIAVPVFLLLMWLLIDLKLFPVILKATGFVALLFILFNIFYAFGSSFSWLNNFNLRRQYSKYMGRAIKIILTGSVIGTLPYVHQYLVEWINEIAPSISAGGLLAMILGWKNRNVSDEKSGKSAWMLRIGLVLLAYGFLLAMHHLALYVEIFSLSGGIGIEAESIIWMSLSLSILVGVLGNINHVSMHRYYRDRLMEAFMARPDLDNAKEEFLQANKFYLKDIQQTYAPYHIINTNMITVASKNPKLRLRGGDNFILSPLYCGAQSTGYANNNEQIINGKKLSGYLGGQMDLATAFTISGAAVDPNTGVTRSRPLAFLMTLLNLRLGYWVRNPLKPATFLKSLSRPWWHLDLLYEMLGIKLNEKHRHVHLSDGGHFENLAIYELVRRKCKYIIASDAAADPDWSFADLAKLIELVRVDFGAEIKIDIRKLQPEGENKISPKSFVTGEITYSDGSTGCLIYIKTTVVSGLNEDIYSYRRDNKAFPDETTADQFFDETQFEAYRELGFQIGCNVFSEAGNTGWKNKKVSEICL